MYIHFKMVSKSVLFFSPIFNPIHINFLLLTWRIKRKVKKIDDQVTDPASIFSIGSSNISNSDCHALNWVVNSQNPLKFIRRKCYYITYIFNFVGFFEHDIQKSRTLPKKERKKKRLFITHKSRYKNGVTWQTSFYRCFSFSKKHYEIPEGRC